MSDDGRIDQLGQIVLWRSFSIKATCVNPEKMNIMLDR